MALGRYKEITHGVREEWDIKFWMVKGAKDFYLRSLHIEGGEEIVKFLNMTKTIFGWHLIEGEMLWGKEIMNIDKVLPWFPGPLEYV